MRLQPEALHMLLELLLRPMRIQRALQSHPALGRHLVVDIVERLAWVLPEAGAWSQAAVVGERIVQQAHAQRQLPGQCFEPAGLARALVALQQTQSGMPAMRGLMSHYPARVAEAHLQSLHHAQRLAAIVEFRIHS